MELIQIYLPLHANDGTAFAHRKFQRVKEQLTEEFGGVTAFLRTPGEGVWAESPSKVVEDDVVTFEVVADRVNRGWWQEFKAQLQRDFEQEEILIRTTRVEIL